MNIQQQEEYDFTPASESDLHRHWHMVNGQGVCPWDCGAEDFGCPGCGSEDCDGMCQGDYYGSFVFGVVEYEA